MICKIFGSLGCTQPMSDRAGRRARQAKVSDARKARAIDLTNYSDRMSPTSLVDLTADDSILAKRLAGQCTRCDSAPANAGHAWCTGCYRVYQEEQERQRQQASAACSFCAAVPPNPGETSKRREPMGACPTNPKPPALPEADGAAPLPPTAPPPSPQDTICARRAT